MTTRESVETVESKEYERIMRVFRRQNEDGSFYYSDAEVRHWLPLALLASKTDMATWTPPMVQVFAEGMQQAGITADCADPCRRLAAYYRKNPVNKEMEAELRTVLNMEQLETSEAMKLRVKSLQKRAEGPGLAAGLAPAGGSSVGLRAKRPKK